MKYSHASPAWKGPLEDGVTQSLLNKFLVCPYRMYLYAILGLEEKRPPEPNLIWGDTGHKGLELLIEKPALSKDFSQEEWDELDQAIDKHLEQYVPFPSTFPHSIKRMLRLYDDSYKLEGPLETEVKFQIPYNTLYNRVTLRGKLDGINRKKIVEHKCKGSWDAQQIEAEVPVDLQVHMYIEGWRALNDCDGIPEVIYDNIRIPDTQFYIPQRRMNQKLSNWVEQWYEGASSGDYPIKAKRHLWLNQKYFLFSDEHHERFMKFNVNPLIDKLCKWWDTVTDPKFDIEDPRCFGSDMYMTPVRHFNPSNTEKFKCEYHSFLTGQLELTDLTPVSSFYPELEVQKETQN